MLKPTVVKTPEVKYRNARNNLMIMIVLTLVNVVLLVLNANMQFLFSASFPGDAYIWGTFLTEETGMEVFRVAALLLGFGNIGLYLLCWLCAKKHRGFMVAALVLFSLDCLVLASEFVFFEIGASIVVDVLFHIYVMGTLISGVVAANQLKKAESIRPVADDPYHTQEQPPIPPQE